MKTNAEIGDVLDRAAELLEVSDANPFRIRSYRRAADAVRDADPPISEQLREGGREALTGIPGIGDRLAGSIEEIADTGRLGLVDSLEAEISPESLLSKVPGIGPTLAARIHRELGVDSLEELEIAAHDGRLDTVEGLGDGRIRGIRDALAGRLTRSAGRRARGRVDGRTNDPEEDPPVALLLEVDERYRREAEAGNLHTIAPRRFNPEGKKWLPIMEVEKDGWSLTALFSNTARAHDLGTTRDWVVIYYEREGDGEDQCTVITAGSGPLEGRRIVVGREQECLEYYG
ncbi:MAG TPA: helix-hairpin-helix domain-containing protein [Chondromyces sp.]|nr:helix-hairpin-helix domain-containing protein [Chondromyces sp.]